MLYNCVSNDMKCLKQDVKHRRNPLSSVERRKQLGSERKAKSRASEMCSKCSHFQVEKLAFFDTEIVASS